MKGISKSEIEKEISGKGEFVKINYLTRFLKDSESTDVKKFIYLKLAEANEKVGMLQDAAKNYSKAGMASILFSEKIKCFVKEAEAYVKSGEYEKTDKAMKKAMVEANSGQKKEIYDKIKEFYKEQAKKYEKNLKRANAAKAYERLLQMKLSQNEKIEIQKNLLELYDKLNRRKDHADLKKKLD